MPFATRSRPSPLAAGAFSPAPLSSHQRDVEIGGVLEGSFDGRTIKVLQTAVFTGELTADIIEVGGIVRGVVRARAIHVTRTGMIEGEMTYETLAVDPGAQVNARCMPACACAA